MDDARPVRASTAPARTATSRAASAGTAGRARAASRPPPGTNSRARKGSGASPPGGRHSPISKICTMCGCCSRAIASASARRRSRRPGGGGPGPEDLQCHQPLEPAVAGLIDRPHPALAQPVEDVEAGHDEFRRADHGRGAIGPRVPRGGPRRARDAVEDGLHPALGRDPAFQRQGARSGRSPHSSAAGTSSPRANRSCQIESRSSSRVSPVMDDPHRPDPSTSVPRRTGRTSRPPPHSGPVGEGSSPSSTSCSREQAPRHRRRIVRSSTRNSSAICRCVQPW